MIVRRVFWLLVITMAAAWGVMTLLGSAAEPATVGGVVMTGGNPVSGASVRVRATDNVTFTDADGRFLLTGLKEGREIEVAAWYSGYYIAGAHLTPTTVGVTMTLRPYHTTDHPEYDWTSPISGTTPGACGNCHPMIMPQWEGNAHGQSVSNPRFFSFYDGTDISGTHVVSPGFRLDFPGTAGNCANCHAPGAAVDGYLTTDMDMVRDVITAGVHCDFCHKVGGVYLDPASGSVYPNAPGVQSQRVLRPPPGDNIFFGPFDDIPDPDTYLPLTDRSQYCAACHQFSFWGTPIYDSYGEWLASSYAAADMTCQDCHMAPNGDSYFALPSAGGLAHPPEQIPSHLQPGAADVDLLQRTVSMTVEADQVLNQLLLTVVITNSGAGHHVPTDHPGRNLILIVSATTADGHRLPQLAGPTVPVWGGAEAGLPGQGYAKLLQDVVDGRVPVVSYWRPTVIASDNRIPALATELSTYIFAVPAGEGEVTLSAQLLFRRLFQPLAAERGWPATDVVMATRSTTLTPVPVDAFYLPAVLRQTGE